MKPNIFLLLTMTFVINLSAQIRPNFHVDPIKKKKTIQLEQPDLMDFKLTKCERHLKYQKMMWKVLLNSNPTSSYPLLLSQSVLNLRFVPIINGTGTIVFDRTSGSKSIPPITNLSPLPGYNPFPVPVSGTTVLYSNPNNNTISTLGFNWETGNYGIINEVKEIYKIGTQNYIDVINSIGVNHTIKIFPAYFMDGCEIPSQ